MPDIPDFLYHAAPLEAALKIANTGLKPMSKGGRPKAYLCMSAVEEGATTLQRKASDIVFRVAGAKLNKSEWEKSGAGKEEWRSEKEIDKGLLECRRFLGTAEQKKWKPASSLVK